MGFSTSFSIAFSNNYQVFHLPVIYDFVHNVDSQNRSLLLSGKWFQYQWITIHEFHD
jgi:hypothetical protein